MLRVIFFALFFLLLACEKPNPTPELLDPIYQDLENELKKAEAEIKSTEKELEGFRLEEKKVQPQTGQIKFAQKRVFETEAKLEKLKQMRTYWLLRKETRQKIARKSYLKAYKEKAPWPDPKEYQDYSLQRKLEQAPLNWNVKRRLEEAAIGIPIAQPGAATEKPEDK